MTTCTLKGDRACENRVGKARDFTRDQLPARLDDTYATIKKAAPRAQLVVLGYPRLFTPSDGCRTLSKRKRQALNDAADELSGVIAAAAKRAGARYVDVREAFADHGVCSAKPWINALVSPTGDSYHPNKAGQAAYFEALTAQR
jgi:lysophospholipase L1-like esterase